MNRSRKNLLPALLSALFLVSSSLVLEAAAKPGSGQSESEGQSEKKAKKSGDSADRQDAGTKKSRKSKKSGEADSPAPGATAPGSSSAPASDSAPAAKQQTTPPVGSGMVWVNTDSGIYHKPGSRWYGKTKQGKYLSEADALKAGYKAAKKNALPRP